jgi:predicted secreted protein
LKLSSNGEIEWQKTYGGSWDDVRSFQQTIDGGYIVAGWTGSFGAGGDDIWILKLSSTGDIEWQKTYGGSEYDRALSVQQTSDGGYIIAGKTDSFGAEGGDTWVLKLSSAGEIEWQKTFGGSSDDYASSIQETSDGGYIIAGKTDSFGAGGDDTWVLKLSSAGEIEWQKTYGGSSDDYASSIQETSDGGYMEKVVGGFILFNRRVMEGILSQAQLDPLMLDGWVISGF